MLAYYFMMPLLGAIYASGWWLWSIYLKGTKHEGFIALFIIVGIMYVIFLMWCTLYDIDKQR
jgi:hypothetical protein